MSKRVILKLSGEALRQSGSQDNISPEIVSRIAQEISEVHAQGIEVGIVVGGGNFWRGASASARGMDRATADYVGMLATVMNALALQGGLESIGVPCIVQTAIEMNNVAEPFIRRKAQRHLANKKIVVFAAGTGNPFFSTDTAAVLRANEINAQSVFKATNVDGVYDMDPQLNPQAKKYEKISFQECLSKQLKIMDATAFSLCMENSIPVVVFDLHQKGHIAKALLGKKVGTYIDN